MWKAWPYGSPGKTTFPSGSVAVVPATATYAPTRTAREYPTIGSQRAPDATFFRSMDRESVGRRKGFPSSRRFAGLHLGRRDFREAGRGGPLRMLQEVRELVRGRFRDRRRIFPRAELPPAPFLEDLQGLGELAAERVVRGSVVDRGDDDEFPADRDDSESLVPHRRDRVPPGQRDARLHEVPDDGEEAFELLRSDRKVPARRQRDEGLAGAVEHVDRGDAFLDRRRPAERLVPVVDRQGQDHGEAEARRDDERGRGPAFIKGGCQGRVQVRGQ